MKPCFLLNCMLAFFCLIGSVFSNSNYNYNAYNYDMAPTFTPDGRLLQVEYASAASERSNPLIALQLDKETVVVMALKNKASPQNRIVVLPTQDGAGIGRPRPAQQTICIGMSGVLGDSLALVQVGLQEGIKHYQSYSKSMTVFQLTRAIADACQKRSFGGGIRPYGATLLICGISPSGEPCLYQTDPSGAIVEASMESSSSSNSDQAKTTLRWLVGGSPTLQRQLRKRLEAVLSKDNLSTQETLTQVAKTLMKESQKGKVSSSTTGSKGAFGSQSSLTVEVVVVNSKLGCQRLTGDALNSMLQGLS